MVLKLMPKLGVEEEFTAFRREMEEVLAAHLKSCVKNARTDEEMEEKVDELVATLDKIMK